MIYRLTICLILGLTLQAWGQTDNDRKLVELENVERAGIGVAPLAWSDQLYLAAHEKAEEQKQHGGSCPVHDSCDGTPWWRRVQRYYPGWTALGENTASSFDDPELTVDGWMASPLHQANIMDPAFNEAGCAVAGPIPGFVVWYEAVCDFGSRGAAPVPTRTPRPSPRPTHSKTPKPTLKPKPSRTSGHR